jgi:predicted glycosyltransferase
VRVWVDIDNAPQARYLLPLARQFQTLGLDVLVTSRAAAETVSILESERVRFETVGPPIGLGATHKALGLTERTVKLIRFVSKRRPVDFLVTGSRAATTAGRLLGISSFIILDYEYVNLFFYRWARSNVVYPSVISGAFLEERGVSRQSLLPFDGLKEDFTFAHVDVETVEPYSFPSNGQSSQAVRVLVRPPAEGSHYYRSESLELSMSLLRHLALEDAEVVYVPRYEHQVDYIGAVSSWKRTPVVLSNPVPSIELFKAVDVVISAGGTMIREAAFLGVPAYSIFKSRVGAVDRHLAETGRLTLLPSSADFSRLSLTRHRSLAPLRQGSAVIEGVAQRILEHTTSAPVRSRRRGRKSSKPSDFRTASRSDTD